MICGRKGSKAMPRKKALGFDKLYAHEERGKGSSSGEAKLEKEK